MSIFKKVKRVAQAGLHGAVKNISSMFGTAEEVGAFVVATGFIGALVGGTLLFEIALYANAIPALLTGLTFVLAPAVGLPLVLIAGASLMMGAVGLIAGLGKGLMNDNAPDVSLARQIEALSPTASAKLLTTIQKKAGSAFTAACTQTASVSAPVAPIAAPVTANNP